MHKLKYRQQARNYLARLPFNTKSEIVAKLHELALDPDNPTLDINPLKGQMEFRLRVEQFRVIYKRQNDELIIEIVRVRARGDVYRR
jgi:mRNA interferase RelE/StbE